MHEYLDAENYIYKYIYISASWWPHGADSGETWEIFLGVWRPEPTESSGKIHHPPPTHPVFQTSHCLLEPVCLNRTSRNPIVYWNPIASGWIQVTSLTFTRLHHPRSTWWYVRSASRPLKTPAGRPVGVWESDPGKFTFWTQSHGGWVRKNFLLKIG